MPPETVIVPGAPWVGGLPMRLVKTSTSIDSYGGRMPSKAQMTSSGASTEHSTGPDVPLTPAIALAEVAIAPSAAHL